MVHQIEIILGERGDCGLQLVYRKRGHGLTIKRKLIQYVFPSKQGVLLMRWIALHH
jgi:hypothetical protein